jgi:DNA polymerase III sliding clamp (beta) subunit (PCNA family)
VWLCRLCQPIPAIHRTAVAAIASVAEGAAIEGELVEITFNAKYMLQVLSVVGTPQVALELTTPATPGLLRPIGDGSFTHVIMPMQQK